MLQPPYVEWQKAHKLPIKEAIDKQGRMTDLAQKYEGMKIEEARKAIIVDMKEANLLKSVAPSELDMYVLRPGTFTTL